MIAQTLQASGYEVALVLAPSNAAVANVAKRLIQDGHFGHKDVNVFGEGCDNCEFEISCSICQYAVRFFTLSLMRRRFPSRPSCLHSGVSSVALPPIKEVPSLSG